MTTIAQGTEAGSRDITHSVKAAQRGGRGAGSVGTNLSGEFRARLEGRQETPAALAKAKVSSPQAEPMRLPAKAAAAAQRKLAESRGEQPAEPRSEERQSTANRDSEGSFVLPAEDPQNALLEGVSDSLGVRPPDFDDPWSVGDSIADLLGASRWKPGVIVGNGWNAVRGAGLGQPDPNAPHEPEGLGVDPSVPAVPEATDYFTGEADLHGTPAEDNSPNYGLSPQSLMSDAERAELATQQAQLHHQNMGYDTGPDPVEPDPMEYSPSFDTDPFADATDLSNTVGVNHSISPHSDVPMSLPSTPTQGNSPSEGTGDSSFSTDPSDYNSSDLSAFGGPGPDVSSSSSSVGGGQSDGSSGGQGGGSGNGGAGSGGTGAGTSGSGTGGSGATGGGGGFSSHGDR